MTAQSGLRVVVVGATGNVGTSVVHALSADPAVESVVAVARRKPAWSTPKMRWVSADITSDPLTNVLHGADAVVTLAWQFQPTPDPHATWRTNGQGSLRGVDGAAQAGVPALIHASSVGAYSPGSKDDPTDENWPTHGWPAAAYTREKAYLERVLDAYEQRHPEIRVVRVRPAFLFKQRSASQQRRLFAGPLLPNGLIRPSMVPVVPDIPGLRFQVMHTDDAADAYRRCITRPVRGPFNLAADPVVDARLLADCLGARVVRLPAGVARAALSALWHLHLIPAAPDLFDAVLRVPIMDAGRAGRELGWTPRYTSRQAIEEFLTGLRHGAGMATPPLAARAEGGRARELATGAGQRE
jgi:nucleoside-diphosphate-sugar epimerase